MLSLYRLPDQLPDEKVIEVVRRDLFILVKRLAAIVGLVILPMLLLAATSYFTPELFNGAISYPGLVLLTSAYYLFVWLFGFFSFIDYYLDVWIITNERIIDIQQQGFFSRIIAEQRHYRIQDVTSEVHGLLPTLLDYGDVYVQTAGEKERFNFYQVPRPNRIRDTIIKLAEDSKHRHPGEL